jgi:hypothetical protein
MVKVISVISWQSVLLVEELEYPEKTTYLPQVTDKLYHFNSQYFTDISVIRGYRGHDCMVVGFTTTYAIVVNSNPGQVSSY